MEVNEVNEAVWQYTGRTLAMLSFFRPFLPSGSVTASNLVQSAYLVHPVPNAVVDLVSPALLITGEARFNMRCSGGFSSMCRFAIMF